MAVHQLTDSVEEYQKLEISINHMKNMARKKAGEDVAFIVIVHI